MEAEWSVAAAHDDPVMVVPWCDQSGLVRFVDVRHDPSRIGEISEAQAWPEIRDALETLNARGSRMMTAKCDAWVLTEEEKELDFGPVLYGFGAYLDMILLRIDDFSSLPQHILTVQELAAAAECVDVEEARVEIVLRPAVVFEEHGYGITLYVYGYGSTEPEARTAWSSALSRVAVLVHRALNL